MKTKQELKDGAYGYKFKIGYEDCEKDILELIDKRIKMLEEIMVNSKQVNKNEVLMDMFKANVKELNELKQKIKGEKD